MPLYIIPRKIAAHRIACKALFRALLVQCPRIPIPYDIPRRGPVNLIKHLIRKHFKANINVTSERLCVKGLERGYATEALLRSAADGNTVALSQIHNFLRTFGADVEIARQQCTQPPPPSPGAPPEIKPRVSSYPGALKVLDIRPLPKEKLTGRRRVPILASANFVPFLRFKKPQSPFLSRVLRNKLVQKQRRIGAIVRIEEEGEIGEAEAEWEREVKGRVESELWNRKGEESGTKRMRKWLKGEGRDFGARYGNQSKVYANGKGSEDGQGTSEWALETVKTKGAIWASVNMDQKKALAVGTKMLRIVEQEKELWEKERRERKAEKKRRPGKDQKPGEGNDGHDWSNRIVESVKGKTEKVEIKPEITAEMQKKLISMRIAQHNAKKLDVRQETETERKLVAMKYQQRKTGMVDKTVQQSPERFGLEPEAERLAIQNAQYSGNTVRKSMKQKPDKVDIMSETDDEMTESKLMAIQNAPPIASMARKEQKAEKVRTKPETNEDMMGRKLMAMQAAQRKANLAAKNAAATF